MTGTRVPELGRKVNRTEVDWKKFGLESLGTASALAAMTPLFSGYPFQVVFIIIIIIIVKQAQST